MRLALQTGPGLCADGRAMATTMRAVDHPAVGLEFDPAVYMLHNEYSSAEVGVQRIWRWVVALRLRDWDGNRDREVYPPPGQGGQVDFARLWQICEGLEFRGLCTIDMRPAHRRAPSLSDCQGWVVESLTHLRRCGWPVTDGTRSRS
jgi:sugar phosphate isomerase/epimerase